MFWSFVLRIFSSVYLGNIIKRRVSTLGKSNELAITVISLLKYRPTLKIPRYVVVIFDNDIIIKFMSGIENRHPRKTDTKSSLFYVIRGVGIYLWFSAFLSAVTYTKCYLCEIWILAASQQYNI